MKKPTIKNPVAKNLAKLHKNAGAHGKTEKAKRRSETVELQSKLTKELTEKKKTS